MTDKSLNCSKNDAFETDEASIQDRFAQAYKDQKRQLEMVEIEMNRAKIVIVDQDGKPVRIPLIKEH